MKIDLILNYPELFFLLQKNYNKIDPFPQQKNYSTSKFENYNIEIDPRPNFDYPNFLIII
mgnify:FL=1